MRYSPYSHSRLSSFGACPQKFKLAYIDKIKIPNTNITLDKGSYIHHCLELFPNPPLSFYGLSEENIQSYNGIIKKFIESPLGNDIVNSPCTIGKELDFGLDIKLNSCNFNNPEALLRGSIDRLNYIYDVNYGEMLHVIDYKSGKYKEFKWQSFDQVKLYVIWLFQNPAFKSVDKIKASYVYVEHNQSNDLIMERKYLNNYIISYIQNIKKIETCETFNKNVTKLCDWCEYKEKGYCDAI